MAEAWSESFKEAISAFLIKSPCFSRWSPVRSISISSSAIASSFMSALARLSISHLPAATSSGMSSRQSLADSTALTGSSRSSSSTLTRSAAKYALNLSSSTASIALAASSALAWGGPARAAVSAAASRAQRLSGNLSAISL